MLQQLQNHQQQLLEIQQLQNQQQLNAQPQPRRNQQQPQEVRQQIVHQLENRENRFDLAQHRHIQQADTMWQRVGNGIKQVLKHGTKAAENAIDPINLGASIYSLRNINTSVGTIGTIAATSFLGAISKVYDTITSYNASRMPNNLQADNKFKYKVAAWDAGNSLLTGVSTICGLWESTGAKIASKTLGVAAGGLGVAARSGSAIRHFKKGEKLDGTISALKAVPQMCHMAGAFVPVASTAAYATDTFLNACKVTHDKS